MSSETNSESDPEFNTYFNVFDAHIKIIRQLTRTLQIYDKKIDSLDPTRKTELDFLKDLREYISKQLEEHQGMCFIISKFPTT
jgi:hypothetical protein